MRITMRQIAKELGVDISTVSRALRNDPKVKEPTRIKIQTKAREMGFERDPALSALNAYRDNKRKASFHGVIAWLTNYESEDGWRNLPMNIQYFEVMKALAKPRGYLLEPFWLSHGKRSANRLSDILRSRGIQGIFLSSLPEKVYRIEFPWQFFSVVSLSETVHEPRVHSAQKSTFFDIQTCVNALNQAGYRSPILAVHDRYHFGMEDLHVSAFRAAVLRNFQQERPCFHCERSLFEQEIEGWVDSAGADSVISSMGCPDFYKQQFPHIAWVHMISSPDVSAENTGIIHRHDVICKAGLDLMTDMLQRAEYGLPDHPFVLRIQGKWNQGRLRDSISSS